MIKSVPLIFALFCALIFSAPAQTSAGKTAPATPAGTTPGPTPEDKIAALKAKFAAGKAMAEQGQFKGALRVFKGILAEDPNARGSLFMAGVMSNQLYDYIAAADYLDRFLTLEPQHTAGLINAVKANQALERTAKVDLYRARLFEKRKLKTDPVLNLMENYERQRLELKDGGYLSIQETFVPTGKDPIYTLLRLGSDLRIVSKEELAKAPEDAGPDMQGSYLWAEPHYKGDVMERYEIKKVFPTLPTYKDVQDLVKAEFAALVK